MESASADEVHKLKATKVKKTLAPDDISNREKGRRGLKRDN